MIIDVILYVLFTMIQKVLSTLGLSTLTINAKSRGRGKSYGCRVQSVANCPICFNKCTSWGWHSDTATYYSSNGQRHNAKGMVTSEFKPCGCVHVGSETLPVLLEDPSAWELVHVP